VSDLNAYLAGLRGESMEESMDRGKVEAQMVSAAKAAMLKVMKRHGLNVSERQIDIADHKKLSSLAGTLVSTALYG